MSFSNSRKQTRQGSRNLCTKLAKEKNSIILWLVWWRFAHLVVFWWSHEDHHGVAVGAIQLVDHDGGKNHAKELLGNTGRWVRHQVFCKLTHFNVIKFFFFYFLELDFVLISFLFRNRCCHFQHVKGGGIKLCWKQFYNRFYSQHLTTKTSLPDGKKAEFLTTVAQNLRTSQSTKSYNPNFRCE